MPCGNEVPVREKGDYMADMKAHPSGVTTHIEGKRSLIHEMGKAIAIGALLEKTSNFKLFQRRIHSIPSSSQNMILV
jgi:hypothetical protein